MNTSNVITKAPETKNAAILTFIGVFGSLLLKLLTIIGESSFVTLTIVSVGVGLIIYFEKSIQSFKFGLSGMEVTRTLETLGAMVAKETEPPQGSFLSVKAYSTDLETKQVMKALVSDQYTWHYLGGIAQKTNLPLDAINKSLGWLVSNDLALELQGNDGKIWGLSPEGRSLLSAIIVTEDSQLPNV